MPRQTESKPPDHPIITAEVVPMFGRPSQRPAHREPPPTDAELAEYRRLKPLLVKMLDEWNAITASGGCPVARHILTR